MNELGHWYLIRKFCTIAPDLVSSNFAILPEGVPVVRELFNMLIVLDVEEVVELLFDSLDDVVITPVLIEIVDNFGEIEVPAEVVIS